MTNDWKNNACNTLKAYYIYFNGTQWHSFNIETDSDLLKVKICYALFGQPSNEKAETIEEAYYDDQKKRAQEIIDNLLQVKRDAKTSELNLGFVFVFCHQPNKKPENQDFCVPVFSVLVSTSAQGIDKINFVDTQGRIYKSWDDWKKTNCLPKVEIAYPKHGYFTCCPDGLYGFDSQKEPIIEFGESPQCSSWSTTKTVGDYATTVTSFGCAAVGILSLITPVAPLVVTASALTGAVGATYGAARGVGALIDKGTHGQSLSDFESLTVWLSIAVTPLHFASSAITGVLARGATQQGRIFSQGVRFAASVLLCTTFGLDTVLISFSLVKLIQKANDKELTSMDVLQFSISVFFFSNTLIQPKTAHGVIEQAQSQHFEKIASTMTDDSVKKTYGNFLENNRIDGSIQDRSKIVRAINRMDDPNKFFSKAAADPNVGSMDIGGRKGRTIIINNKHGSGSERVNPNKYEPPSTSTNALVLTPTQPGKLSNNAQKEAEKKEKKGFGKNKDPSHIEPKDEKILDTSNLTDIQKWNINRVLGGTAKHIKTVTTFALAVAERMGYEIPDSLVIVEIVSTTLAELSNPDISNWKVNSFVEVLLPQLARAKSIAEARGLHFGNVLEAMYQYQKHGAEFPDHLKKYSDTMEVCIGQVKGDVFDYSNLRQICDLPDGSVKFTFVTDKEQLGIVISKLGQADVSTVYYKPGCTTEFPRETVSIPPAQDAPRLGVPELTMQIANTLGLPTFRVVVSENGGEKKSYSYCDDLSEAYHSAIARLLITLIEAI